MTLLGWIILWVAITVAGCVAIYFFTKRMKKKQDEQEAQLEAYKQTYSMLVIDKKKMRIKEAGFPENVVAQMPKFVHLMKYPIVKAKLGPRVMTFLTDKKVFDQIPVKKEIKADVSGLYITAIRSVRGGSVSLAPKKKSSKIDELLRKGRGEI